MTYDEKGGTGYEMAGQDRTGQSRTWQDKTRQEADVEGSTQSLSHSIFGSESDCIVSVIVLVFMVRSVGYTERPLVLGVRGTLLSSPLLSFSPLTSFQGDRN